MDNADDRVAVTGAVPFGNGTRTGKETSWLQEGWRPYHVHEHQALSNLRYGWRLRGKRNGDALDLYVKASNWNSAALVQVRRKMSGGFRLSASVPAEDGNMQEVETDAYENVSDLQIREASEPPQIEAAAAPSQTSSIERDASTVQTSSRHNQTNFAPSLGWRSFDVETMDPVLGVTGGWRLRGSWFCTAKVLYLEAIGWESATEIYARRENETLFSVSARICDKDGNEERITVDAFERPECIELSEPSQELQIARKIEQRLKAGQNGGPGLMLIVGTASNLVLNALAARFSIETFPLAELVGSDPTNPTSHIDLLAWASELRRDGPVLMDGSKLLPTLAKRANPLWALAMLSLGRQVVAVWPGSYSEGKLTLANQCEEFSYSASNISVWIADYK